MSATIKLGLNDAGMIVAEDTNEHEHQPPKEDEALRTLVVRDNLHAPRPSTLCYFKVTGATTFAELRATFAESRGYAPDSFVFGQCGSDQWGEMDANPVKALMCDDQPDTPVWINLKSGCAKPTHVPTALPTTAVVVKPERKVLKLEMRDSSSESHKVYVLELEPTATLADLRRIVAARHGIAPGSFSFCSLKLNMQADEQLVTIVADTDSGGRFICANRSNGRMVWPQADRFELTVLDNINHLHTRLTFTLASTAKFSELRDAIAVRLSYNPASFCFGGLVMPVKDADALLVASYADRSPGYATVSIDLAPGFDSTRAPPPVHTPVAAALPLMCGLTPAQNDKMPAIGARFQYVLTVHDNTNLTSCQAHTINLNNASTFADVRSALAARFGYDLASFGFGGKRNELWSGVEKQLVIDKVDWLDGGGPVVWLNLMPGFNSTCVPPARKPAAMPTPPTGSILMLNADFSVNYDALVRRYPPLLAELYEATECNRFVQDFDDSVGLPSKFYFAKSDEEHAMITLSKVTPIETVVRLPAYATFLDKCARNRTLRNIPRSNPIWLEILAHKDLINGTYRYVVPKYPPPNSSYSVCAMEDACGNDCVTYVNTRVTQSLGRRH